MVLTLCDDEWRCISDYLQDSALSHVCRRTWAVLQRRHLSWHVNEATISQVVAVLLEWDTAVHTVTLTCSGLKDSGACALASLSEMPRLECLSLYLMRNGIQDQGAIALTTLAQAPCLRFLGLHLYGNKIKLMGALVCVRARCHGPACLQQVA